MSTLPSSITDAQAPVINQGLINSAFTAAPTVTGSNVAGNVAQINSSYYDPSMKTNAQSVAGQANTSLSGPTRDATTTQSNVTNWNVDNPQTVQGQLSGILASGSPLLQRAQAMADAKSNERGLVNTTMGVQAGQAALYDAAMPIATADANTYANSAKSNADAANQNSIFNAGQANQTSQFNAGQTNQNQQFNASALNDTSKFNAGQTTQNNQFNAGEQNDLQRQVLQQRQAGELANASALNNARQFDAAQGLQAQLANQSASVQQTAMKYDAAVKTAMANADSASKLQLQQIDAQTRTSLADIQAKYNVQMQTSQSMSSTFNQMVQSISSVMSDPNMDAGAKQNAINQLTGMYQGSLDVQHTVSGLNLGTLLAPQVTAPAAPPPAAPPPPAPAPAGGGYYQPTPYTDYQHDPSRESSGA